MTLLTVLSRLRTNNPKGLGATLTVDFRIPRRSGRVMVTLFRDYPHHAEAIAHMFALAEQVDKEVSCINGTAPDGEHRRLQPVELEARGLERFTRDEPSLTTTVELRDFENSARKLWPVQCGSFAAAYAESMPASMPHPSGRWGEPEVAARRRAEAEKQNREIAANYQRMAADQEDRLERERIAALRR